MSLVFPTEFHQFDKNNSEPECVFPKIDSWKSYFNLEISAEENRFPIFPIAFKLNEMKSHQIDSQHQSHYIVFTPLFFSSSQWMTENIYTHWETTNVHQFNSIHELNAHTALLLLLELCFSLSLWKKRPATDWELVFILMVHTCTVCSVLCSSAMVRLCLCECVCVPACLSVCLPVRSYTSLFFPHSFSKPFLCHAEE